MAHLHQPSGLLDLRVVAIGRLMLDNFAQSRHTGFRSGVGTAQVALAYGADDLDGTVREERIHHEAGSPPRARSSARAMRTDRRGRLRASRARLAVRESRETGVGRRE